MSTAVSKSSSKKDMIHTGHHASYVLYISCLPIALSAVPFVSEVFSRNLVLVSIGRNSYITKQSPIGSDCRPT